MIGAGDATTIRRIATDDLARRADETPTGLSTVDRVLLVAAFERAVREISSVRAVRARRRVAHGAGYEASARDAAEDIAIIDFDDLAARGESLASRRDG